jgi:hypothetical protein
MLTEIRILFRWAGRGYDPVRTPRAANEQEKFGVTVTDKYLANDVDHTDCGVLTFSDDEFKAAIQQATGIKPGWAAEAFPDIGEDVRQSLRRTEQSPFVTKHESLRGFVFDVATGQLHEVAL